MDKVPLICFLLCFALAVLRAYSWLTLTFVNRVEPQHHPHQYPSIPISGDSYVFVSCSFVPALVLALLLIRTEDTVLKPASEQDLLSNPR